jgi:hypothetical protein
MNNSGQTETFKYSGFSTSITFGSGTDSIKSTNATTASGTNSIAIGKGAGAGGNNSVNIGTNSVSIGTDSVNIGNNPGLNTSSNQITIGSGGYNNNPYGIAIGHSTSSQQAGICIGSNTTRATGLHSVSLGNSIENNLGSYSIMVGYNNSCYSPFNGNPYGVVIGSGHRVDNTGFYNTILGGANTTISGASNTFIGNGVGLTSVRTGDIIINSSGNTITGTGTYKISIGGFGNTISASGNNNGIIGGSSNSITTTSSSSAIIGGTSNTITAKDRAVMLGCSGRTATTSTATFVENIHIYRTPSTEVQPISSGTTFTCNLDNGAKAQFYLTGSSTINITNVRDGQSFMIKTQTNGSYTTTWSSTGYTFYFRDEIRNPGNTTIDIWTFEVFGNVIYGSRGYNYSIQL